MIFSSSTFIVFFFALLALYLCANTQKQRAGILLAGSLIFYGSWKLAYVPLFFFSLAFNYWIYKSLLKNKSKYILWIAIVADLAVLAFFKYLVLFTESAFWFLNLAGVSVVSDTPSWMDWALPLGISFFTFQMISALVDVYKGDWDYDITFAKWCLYVSFFPQLIAGPIVRAHILIRQLDDLKPVKMIDLRLGAVIFVGGLIKKVLFADNIGPIVDEMYAQPEQLTFFLAWVATLGFALQIYFDFSGYSEMALGLARMFGISLPRNFLYPYISRNFPEFWRRWHITLSQWLRDYLYIAMGGSRCSTYRTYQNLLVTMLLGGLWHGAGWGFVFWGFLHGMYLIGHRLLVIFYERVKIIPESNQGRVLSWLGIPLTFVLVNFAWVFFRAGDFSDAMQIVYAMCGLAEVTGSSPTIRLYQLILLALGYVIIFTEPWIVKQGVRLSENWWWNIPFPVRGVVYASLVLGLVVFGGATQKFVYFDF